MKTEGCGPLFTLGEYLMSSGTEEEMQKSGFYFRSALITVKDS